MREVYGEDIIPNVNQDKPKIVTKNNQVTGAPYQHPNYKSHHFNQSTHQCHFEQRISTY